MNAGIGGVWQIPERVHVADSIIWRTPWFDYSWPIASSINFIKFFNPPSLIILSR